VIDADELIWDSVAGTRILLSEHGHLATTSAHHWRARVAALSGVPAEQVCIVAPRGRAPTAWISGVRWWMSFSSSGGMRACALRHLGPVGVDLESTDPTPPIGDSELEHMMAMALGPDEIARCGSAADPTRAFLTAWTIKEAVLKAAGVGLSVDPRCVKTTVGGAAEANLDGTLYDVSIVTTMRAVLSVAIPRLDSSEQAT
jgi:phosphopantetheinyl transferase